MRGSCGFTGPIGILLSIAAGTPTIQAQEVDMLIREARVVDGTGGPSFISDVALSDGRIVALGKDLDVDAGHTIDADGRILAPGFIDVHTHAESTGRPGGLERVPRADNFLLDGVTTIVTGNCGGSETDIGAWSRSLAGLGVNVATLIGHNSIRRRVMGSADRKPSERELEQMQALVEKAMRDGALGLSTGLLYVPGTYAKTDEVVSLAAVASRYGGIYTSHIREQGALLHESIDEAVSVGREANIPVQISHFKVKGRSRWGTIGEAIALVEEHRAGGVDVLIDVYPYERASTNLGVNLPRWALESGPDDVKTRIEDPATRERIVAEMKDILADQGYDDYSFAAVAQYAPNPDWEGKTISEINLLSGREPTLDNEIETILEMMLASAAASNSYGPSMIYHYMSLEDVAAILRYPNAIVASDGAVVMNGVGQPHPRSYGTNARVLSEFVRERELITLEDAVRRMTALPARTFGFHDRGIVRPGFVADLVLFDPDRVSDRATFGNPHQYSEGFDYVIVNGKTAVAHGVPTDERPGVFVTGPGYTGAQESR